MKPPARHIFLPLPEEGPALEEKQQLLLRFIDRVRRRSADGDHKSVAADLETAVALRHDFLKAGLERAADRRLPALSEIRADVLALPFILVVPGVKR